MSNTINISTLENPTREFLHANYKKDDLQKHCRDLGFPKVWVKKDQLIDMILENHRSSRPPVPERNVQVEQLTERDVIETTEETRERENARDKEIEDLKELLHSAHVTINKLSDRVSLLEEKVTLLHDTSSDQPLNPSPQGSSSSNFQPEGTLLLGDTNLSAVRASDLLSNHCSVRTIRGANIDLLKCWISEKLQWAPSNCIIYCGLQDILDKSTPCEIFDRLGSLVAELKKVNENMNIHICELVPIPNVGDFDEHINNFNHQIAAWSTNNGVKIIKTNLQYRLGTGEVDLMCFNDTCENDNNFLNRFGIIRLLNVISKQCPSLKLHEDWENIMSQSMPTFSYNPRKINNYESNPQKTNDEETRNLQSQRFDVRGRLYSRPNTRQLNSHTNSRHNEDSSRPIRTFNRGQRDINARRNNHHSYYDRRNNYLGSQNFSRYRRQHQGWANQQWESPINHDLHRICSNCGEKNHSLSECRYNHRVKCNQCNEFGHKTRLCPYDT